jgi:hypothetical protein
MGTYFFLYLNTKYDGGTSVDRYVVCRYLRFTQNTDYQNKHWYRFFPSNNSLIGSRSERTLNLITTDIKPCYTPKTAAENKKRKPVEFTDECGILEFVFGCIPDGPTAEPRCLVNADKVYTLILSMSWELGLGKRNLQKFALALGYNWLSNYFLVFISTNKTVTETLCDYGYGTHLMLLNCEDTFRLFDTVTIRKMTRSPRTWYTSLVLQHSITNTLHSSIQRQAFTQQRADEFLMVECLNRANESAEAGYFHAAEMSILSFHEPLTSSSVLVADLTTRFISCFEKPTLIFWMYFKPFHAEVWGLIALCFSGIAVVIHIYNRMLNLSASFSPIFFFLSTLVEEPYSVPNALWNSRIFKIITLGWLLTAIVFTNLYIGLMISDVTAPVRGEIFNNFDKVLGITNESMTPSRYMLYDVRTFWQQNHTSNVHLDRETRQIEGCHTLYLFNMNLTHESVGYERHLAQFRNSESFAVLQKEIDKCNGIAEIPNEFRRHYQYHPWMYSVFSHLLDELIKYKPLFSRYSIRLYALFSPRNRHYPKDPQFSKQEIDKIPIYTAAAIEKELVACERSIFVGEYKDVITELSYLKTNYPRKHFYISNDTFEGGWSTPVVWIFRNSGSSKFPRYFQLLWEAGVRDVLLGLRKQKYYLKRRVGTQYIQERMLRGTNIGMSGSIQTVFIISIASFSVATLVFLLEIVHVNRLFFKLSTYLIQWCIPSLKAV